MDRICQLLRSTIGHRFADGPGGSFGFGSALRVPWPTASIGLWCSKAELMIGVMTSDKVLLPYLNSTLLIRSGPDACSFLRVSMAFFYFILFDGDF